MMFQPPSNPQFQPLHKYVPTAFQPPFQRVFHTTPIPPCIAPALGGGVHAKVAHRCSLHERGLMSSCFAARRFAAIEAVRRWDGKRRYRTKANPPCKLDRITNRDMNRGDRRMRGLKDGDIRPLFEQLAALGWLLPVTGPRRDSSVWLVNPAVHRKLADRAEQEAQRRADAHAAISGLMRDAD